MLEVKQLSKKFGKDVVVDIEHIKISRGTIYGLLGSNGAGKTTLLKMLSGIIKPTSGAITFEESPIYENRELKARVVFIPDQPFFFQHYSIKQLADFYREQYPSFDEARFLEFERIFKLDTKKKVHTFSKGMQRQVSFWLALSAQPDYLILDEPFDGLDAVVRKKIKNLIIRDVAERDMTVIISSHNLREVEDLCNYIGIIHKGKYVIDRDIDDLKTDVHKVQIAFKEIPDRLFKDFHVLHHETRGSVHMYIVKGELEDIKQSITLSNPILCDILPLTLEEIFVYEMEGIGYAMDHVLV
ncbi:ABC transporter ATP-binding protein [Halolactibacillus alkaliphilus]|uniref:ABC transporter ATP-binding protein n=1 Tax=Halolactibacillus alkaliphilus TaxID=442899 RepID=A0A511X3W8_9BACI|nr:ABC transporter ATP-binding protein [Halolactibacillus alkaliphilus]GEN57649.1 ABC transporter ATP-binding protein [Halolactibacillus alkaliphilus]GGN74518.1 ABC transporter ATP-binding protein [Halolactibacillus alkaliphilus]SFP02119.1 ABC-2 type transport system ATP-binding protein [Halolactibacillus alkaliphilus]